MNYDEMKFKDVKKIIHKEIYNRGKGIDCPCCGRKVKTNMRTITKVMADCLIKLYERNGREWVHLEKWLKSQDDIDFSARGDIAKLCYWKLVEKQIKGNKFDTSVRCGIYRITDIGIKFISGDLEVRKYFWIYNKKIVDIDCYEMININHCIKN